MDIILGRSGGVLPRVDEIDTTGKTAPEVAKIVARIIKDELELPPGQVDWLIDFFWPEN